MTRILPLIAAASLALGASTALSAQELTEDQIKALALEAIRENPQIVMEAVAILQQQEQVAAEAAAATALSSNRDLLENDPNAPVMGNPDGDVTIVEFFDYNCPYCRRAVAEVRAALEADGNIRLVMREWPILGPASVVAARAALAADRQGKYQDIHLALMAQQGRLTEEAIMETAASLGLDMDQLRSDMESPEVEAHIATSMDLAVSLDFSGTPAFVVGEALAPGLIETPVLLEMVEAARAAR